MSAIHILNGSGDTYTVVVHIAVPGGNNAAGVLWSDAVKNSGRNQTVMVTGTGAGQITSAEAASVVAGTVLEGVFQWQDNPALTPAQRQAAVSAYATQLSNEMIARYSVELKYFGYVR